MKSTQQNIRRGQQMVALENELSKVCQAIAVNVRLMKQLAADLPLYAASDWDAKAIPFITRLQVAISKLDELCQRLYDENLDEQAAEIMRCFVDDMREPLAIIRGTCNMIHMFIPPQDAALVTFKEILEYTGDTYEIIYTPFAIFQKRDN